MRIILKRAWTVILAVLAGTITQTGRADLISGGFQFNGYVTLDGASAATSTAVTAWNAFVFGFANSGAFAAPSPYALTNGQPILFAPTNWYFNTTHPITNFWSVGGFKFELQTSAVSSQGGIEGVTGYVSVSGTGIVSGNGYDPTAFSWQFIASDPSFGGYWQISGGLSSLETNGAPMLNAGQLGGEIIVSWADPTFTLQTASAVAGPFTNVPDATSPYTNSFSFEPRFFRLNQ